MGSTLGLKLKQLRSEYSFKNKFKLTQSELAKRLGISRGYLSDIESGRTDASKEIIVKLCEFFEITLEELMQYRFDDPTKDDYQIWDSTLNLIKVHESAAIYGSINIDTSTIINIPIVGVVRAGQSILATENIEGYQPTLKNSLCTDRDYFYLRVQGDSMNQEFNEGSLLLIEKTQYIENGQIGIILIDGQDATVKKVIKNDNMITLIPMSTNPNHIPHMYDVVKDEIRIVGRVKQVVKNYY